MTKIKIAALAVFAACVSLAAMMAPQGETRMKEEAAPRKPVTQEKPPVTLMTALAAMKKCDVAVEALEKALMALPVTEADKAAKAISSACHSVSPDYYAAAPASQTDAQEQEIDQCGDAYFAPERIAEHWLKRGTSGKEEVLAMLNENRMSRRQCGRHLE
ncbi:hypothetical protein BRX37_16495 [Sphingomonas sp. S-NIH.Pt3_0716]|nr:hypothetical protein BRX37_16495 [Sphingomonas sp. S-NIH.Pt3_0716]